MCYSKNISIYSFTTSIITNLFLIYYANNAQINEEYAINLKIVGYGMMFVGFMQLFDYIFWTNQIEKKTNFVTTKLAMIFNHLQPIVFLTLFLLLKGTIGKWSSIIIGVYSMFAIIYTYNAWKKTNYTLVTDQSRPGLFWEWNYQPYATYFYTLFLLSLTVLFWENMNYPLNLIGILISNLTFFYSLIKYNNKGDIGRMWCYFASLSSLLFLIK